MEPHHIFVVLRYRGFGVYKKGAKRDEGPHTFELKITEAPSFVNTT